MAKKKKKAALPDAAQTKAPEEGGITPSGKKIILAGIGALLLGFFVLGRTDMYGRNWASTLSPFLILGAYATIAIGILWNSNRDAKPPEPPAREPENNV